MHIMHVILSFHVLHHEGSSMTKIHNVVFLLADDMGAWALHAAGNNDVITPNLDKLAENGTRFDNFFCVSPVCSPARASILTGTIPSSHGVHDWLRSGNLDKDSLGEISDNTYFREECKPIGYLDGMTCYTDELAANGYDCALVGKWHLGDSVRMQHGFSYWYTIGRGGCDYNCPDIVENGKISIDDKYITDLITEKAIDYLDNHSSDKPFYLSIHYTAPHSPWDEEQHPADIYKLYENCTFESSPDLPIHPNQVCSAPYGTGEERKRLLRGYYTAITAMDRGIGQILEKIDSLGLKENTMVVFSGDNGMNMGHHGVWGKGNGTFPLNMYDSSVKVPMIFSCPGMVPSGKVEHKMLSHYDIYPTLLDFCNVESCNTGLPGRSFIDLFKNQETPVSNESLVVFDEYGTTRMIRTMKHKLVYRYPYGPHELYDLEKDPDEMENFFDHDEYREIQENLIYRLGEWFSRYVKYDKDGVREGVTGFGQLCECGLKARGRKVYHDLVKKW